MRNSRLVYSSDSGRVQDRGARPAAGGKDVKENAHEIEAFRRYWKVRGAEVKVRPMLEWTASGVLPYAKDQRSLQAAQALFKSEMARWSEVMA